MIPYFLIALFLFIFSVVEATSCKEIKYYQSVLLFLVFLVLLLFSSLASSRGDALTYLNIFNNPDSYYFIEPGFIWLNRFVKNANGSVFIVFGFMSILSVGLKMLSFSKHVNYVFISIFYYYTSTFIPQEMGAVRFALASSTVLFSTCLIEAKKKRWALIVILLVSFFHFSVVTGLVLIILHQIPVGKKTSIITISFIVLLYFLKIDIVEYIMYFGSKVFPTYGSKAYNYIMIEPRAALEFGIIRRLLLYILCIIMLPKNVFTESLIIKCYLVSIIIYFLFAPINIVAQRFSVLFSCVEPVVIVILLNKIKKNEIIFAFLPLSLIQFYNLFHTLTMYSDFGNTWLPYTIL